MQLKAARVLGHLSNRRRKTAGTIVGDGVVEAAVPGLNKKIEHAALGDGIANLNRGYGRAFVKFLRRKSGAMNAILADASADHDNAVPLVGFFYMAGPFVNDGRHDRTGSAVNQGFAQKAGMKDNGAVNRRDAAFIAPVLDTRDHALEDAPGMKQARRQFLLEKRRGETEDIGVEKKACTLAGTERVTVDADDAGQGTTVRVEGAG